MLHFTHAGWFLNDGGRSVLCLTFNRSQAIFIHTDPARQRSRCQRCHRNHGNHSFLWHYLDGSVHDHATDDLRLVGLLPLPSLSVVDYCGHVGPRMCRAGFGNLSAERQRRSRQQAERRGSRLHLHTFFLSFLLHTVSWALCLSYRVRPLSSVHSLASVPSEVVRSKITPLQHHLILVTSLSQLLCCC